MKAAMRLADAIDEAVMTTVISIDGEKFTVEELAKRYRERRFYSRLLAGLLVVTTVTLLAMCYVYYEFPRTEVKWFAPVGK